MSNYKISLAIPCYNIKNITNDDDSFENIELLLINNGSTDSTKDILDDLSNKYENVKIHTIPKNTGGPSIPRNIGIENATADYVMLLDADDQLNPEMMEILYDHMQKYECDIIKTDFNVVIEGKIHKKDMGIGETLLAKNKSADLKYVSLYIWDCIYNREFLMDNNLRFENVRGEDYMFMIDCISKTEKDIFLINNYEGLNYNSDNLSSLSHNCFDLENLNEQTYVSDKCLGLISDDGFSQEYVEFLSSYLKFSLMIYLFYSNNSQEIKNQMYDVVRDFLKKYEHINFVKINELNASHHMLWKTFNYLIKNNHRTATFSLINLLKKIKQSDRT